MSRGSRITRKRYFDWLYSKVLTVQDPESPISYVEVCTKMHSIPFMDNVPNDDNRTGEGIELRSEFIASLRSIQLDGFAEVHAFGEQASIFEMLVAFCRRCNYIAEIGDAAWFRKFLENLGLVKYCDSRYRPADDARISRILTTMNERTYTPAGVGGLFPLRRPEEDQRNIELWYQMAAYMRENRMY